MRVTDKIIEMAPKSVCFSGGEPLLINELFEVAERFRKAKIDTVLYTSGWHLNNRNATQVASSFSQVSVSIDAPFEQLNDQIRGRRGAYRAATQALHAIDDAISSLKRANLTRVARLRMEVVVIRSNLNHLHKFCSLIDTRFPMLEKISFGTVIPSGLASRPAFVEVEVLRDKDYIRLFDEIVPVLKACGPSGVSIEVVDQRFMSQPGFLSSGGRFNLRSLHIEPDGRIRALDVCEGTVGNVLENDGNVILEKMRQRWEAGEERKTVSGEQAHLAWGERIRAIDRSFGGPAVVARIGMREEYVRIQP